jgi:hypothetical protein
MLVLDAVERAGAGTSGRVAVRGVLAGFRGAPRSAARRSRDIPASRASVAPPERMSLGVARRQFVALGVDGLSPDREPTTCRFHFVARDDVMSRLRSPR